MRKRDRLLAAFGLAPRAELEEQRRVAMFTLERLEAERAKTRHHAAELEERRKANLFYEELIAAGRLQQAPRAHMVGVGVPWHVGDGSDPQVWFTPGGHTSTLATMLGRELLNSKLVGFVIVDPGTPQQRAVARLDVLPPEAATSLKAAWERISAGP